MSDQIREQVSALLDGELAEGELDLLVRRLERDAELKRAFASYALAGEILRAPGGVVASPGFAARVSAALDDGARVEAVAPAAARPRTARWRAPLVGSALAAGAAVVAVLLMRPTSSELRANFPDRASPVDRRPLLAANLPDDPEAALSNQRLANYLVAHGQVANALGRRNVWSGLLADDPAIIRASYDVAE